MKVMILAAGLGTRLIPHTLTTPKAAMPFLNTPLAAYGLELIAPIKPKGLVVNTYHLPELVEKLFANHLAAWVPKLEFSPELGFIRGSGGGLKQAERFFEGEQELILMNADEVFFPEDPEFLVKAIEFHRSKKALSTLITTHHNEVGKKFGGVWTDEQDKIIGFGKERLPLSKKGQHYIGIQILSSEIFKYISADKDCNILYDGLQTAIQEKKSCWAYPVQGLWFETGSQVDFLDATRESLNLLTLKNLQRTYLSNFLKKYSPQSHFIQTPDALVLAHQNAKWTSNQIKNFAVLGDGSEIASGAHVDSSVIAAGMKVRADFNFGIKIS